MRRLAERQTQAVPPSRPTHADRDRIVVTGLWRQDCGDKNCLFGLGVTACPEPCGMTRGRKFHPMVWCVVKKVSRPGGGIGHELTSAMPQGSFDTCLRPSLSAAGQGPAFTTSIWACPWCPSVAHRFEPTSYASVRRLCDLSRACASAIALTDPIPFLQSGCTCSCVPSDYALKRLR